ncbi:hypothetical protein CORC01_10903 [Colletotrichum orchidophilum]|uniref:Uncharacterized protein n=1 Tax=Colletotrichum orchidophilum TaxID=1209926 RepID=A0A1G4AXB0_9PEZI|nr:uncharacterized protein CORC01_10903 [Colletotrichum orchidophilum]OHE93777.1 hypothetical protein CORC01_10903 [Colletotrichum orchidophilum]
MNNLLMLCISRWLRAWDKAGDAGEDGTVAILHNLVEHFVGLLAWTVQGEHVVRHVVDDRLAKVAARDFVDTIGVSGHLEAAKHGFGYGRGLPGSFAHRQPILSCLEPTRRRLDCRPPPQRSKLQSTIQTPTSPFYCSSSHQPTIEHRFEDTQQYQRTATVNITPTIRQFIDVTKLYSNDLKYDKEKYDVFMGPGFKSRRKPGQQVLDALIQRVAVICNACAPSTLRSTDVTTYSPVAMVFQSAETPFSRLILS